MVAVRPHMGVFGLYVGLTATGYNLAKPAENSPIGQLTKAIRMAEWPSSVRRYFAMARSRSGGINPYWPKAAMLLEACFYLEDSGESFNPSDELALLRTIAEFPVNPADKSATVVDWARGFPAAYSELTRASVFPMLWTSYLDAVQPLVTSFEKAASATLESLTRAGVRGDSLPEIVVVPNLLQAPELADFVRRPGILYVVVAEPRMSSMVHELLHDVLGPILRSNKVDIAAHRHLLRPVLPAMLRMQYAWADDDESWLRVFEESLMRAAAIWLESERSPAEGDKQAQNQWRQGFIYVPALLDCLRKDWRGPNISTDFIRRCLRACTRSIAQA